ncbi:hypothetical protein N7499_011932 [Penicillium canescens]|uniref:Lipase, secreted n=1 Tax=Penicillium canescens TaxID=5083 RepID=A0AAD6IL48_PENCN|nr:uncharacterized protein N7446_007203 [Penicillium canescens]KAJ5991274.1 hypothetical protein N7522_011481 [Penicillium canescens]KAJ6052563.1 hypothetical protein N7460_003097 [Penicillium canescens]KAJ6063083.1 hypothetical protein N7446_007203 [Penicillium canescens]KAJ6070045.1 hypothetical protein N7499_011932 [Penicillium canescens]KAJ6181904.1 hypothetical protein N7485_000546 [Penicillium canescens]
MALSIVRMVRLALVGFMALLSIASALPAADVSVRAVPQDPSTDPFYQPPAGFESKAPGTILRQRKISASFFGFIPNPVKAYQLLYRTTAINGSAIATVTTIFKPLIAKNDRFVSFHTAYDSSAVKCNPSYSYQLGAPQTDLISSAETFIIEAYLLLGYTVASPDYEGPDAAFGPGRLEGMGVLDGIRAVNNFKDTLGLKNPMVVGVGYSGGALATGWAASLHPSYAPELNVKGWVQGGTPSNLTGTLVFIDDTAFAGFLPTAVVGLSKPSAYGAELNPILNSILTDTGREKLDFAATHCAVENLFSFGEMSLFSTDIQSLGRGLLTEPTIQSVMNKNIMAVNKAETPTVPVFVYHATQDEVIPYANASTMVNSWCGWDANVKFTTYANGGHATTELIALPDALKFVENAFAGKTASGCTQNTELASVLNPIALGVSLEPLLLKLIEALAHLGKQDANVKSDTKVLAQTIT